MPRWANLCQLRRPRKIPREILDHLALITCECVHMCVIVSVARVFDISFCNVFPVRGCSEGGCCCYYQC